jgi:hypothetical protein
MHLGSNTKNDNIKQSPRANSVQNFDLGDKHTSLRDPSINYDRKSNLYSNLSKQTYMLAGNTTVLIRTVKRLKVQYHKIN